MENPILADHKSQTTLADSQRRHQKSDSADSAAKRRGRGRGCLVRDNKIGTYEYHKRRLTRSRCFVAGRNGSERLAGSTRKRQWLGVTKAVKQVESPNSNESSNPLQIKLLMNRSPRQSPT